MSDESAKHAARGCGIVVLVCGLLFGASIAYFALRTPPALTADPAGAWSVCKQFVTQRLRSPGSAKFPFFGQQFATPVGGDAYRVRSYVDSQNGFGALLRSEFTCDVTWIRGTTNWRLGNLALVER